MNKTSKSSVIVRYQNSYIFNHQQVDNILQAADHTPPNSRSPMRHLIMPEVFRLLYCCGMRVSEVIRLKFSDVNLAAGILTILKSKFNKDRLVPLAPTMTARLRRYASILGEGDSSSVFFPKVDGKPYRKETVYYFFRQLLWQCNIPHGGRGKGPRLHDLRHYAEFRIMPSPLPVSDRDSHHSWFPS